MFLQTAKFQIKSIAGYLIVYDKMEYIMKYFVVVDGNMDLL